MANIYKDLLNAFELEGSSDSEDEQDQPYVVMIHVLFVCYMNCMQNIKQFICLRTASTIDEKKMKPIKKRSYEIYLSVILPRQVIS